MKLGHFVASIILVLAPNAFGNTFYFCSPTWTDVENSESSKQQLANSKVMLELNEENEITELTFLGSIAEEEFENSSVTLKLSSFTKNSDSLVNGSAHHTNNYRLKINGSASTKVKFSRRRSLNIQLVSAYEDGSLNWSQSSVCRK